MLFRTKLDEGFFSAPPDLSHIFHLNKPVQHQEATYLIDSLATLEKLLTEHRLRKEHPVLRFLVDLNGVAWFARETRPGILAPKHFQMTGESQNNASCRTAGNIKFTNSKCRVLKSINHRSGDFQPSFYSLRLFLAILILNEEILPFKLPRFIAVKEYHSNGEQACKHKWSVAQIREWVKTFSSNEELVKQLKKQDMETKKVYYQATASELCFET